MTTQHPQGHSESPVVWAWQGEDLPEFLEIYTGAGDAVVASRAVSDHMQHDHEAVPHNSEECWRDVVATQHPFGPPFHFK